MNRTVTVTPSLGLGVRLNLKAKFSFRFGRSIPGHQRPNFLCLAICFLYFGWFGENLWPDRFRRKSSSATTAATCKSSSRRLKQRSFELNNQHNLHMQLWKKTSNTVAWWSETIAFGSRDSYLGVTWTIFTCLISNASSQMLFGVS